MELLFASVYKSTDNVIYDISILNWIKSVLWEFNPFSVGLIFNYFLCGEGALDAPPPLKPALFELEKF